MGTKLSVPTEEVPADRTFIVTGANTGIGYHTAKKIAELGGRVVIACRSEEKSKNAIERMQEEHKQSVRAKRKAEADKKVQVESVAAASSKKEEVKGEVKEEKVEEKEESKEEKPKDDVKEETETRKDESKEETATGEEVKGEEVKGEEKEAGDKKEETDGSEQTKEGEPKEEKEKDGEEAVEQEKEKEPEPEEEILPLNIQFMPLDLSSLKSTMDFVKQYKDSGLPLHVLVCNAGLFLPNKSMTDDGFETQFQVNYLSHFLLTLHLLPLLKAGSPNARIVNVSSFGHKLCDSTVNLDNIQAQNSYSAMKFYANSKLFQLMNMYTLSAKVKDAGINIFSLHPGSINSEFTRNYSGLYKVVDLVSHKALGRNTVEGSLTTLTAALDKAYNDKTALYFSSCKPTQPNNLARNEDQQNVLWRYSLELLRDHLDDTILSEISESLEKIQPKPDPVPDTDQEEPKEEEKKSEDTTKDDVKGEDGKEEVGAGGDADPAPAATGNDDKEKSKEETAGETEETEKKDGE